MNDYNKSLEFWNSIFAQNEGYKVEGKFVKDETINKIFETYINSDSNVLDFGCGAGWGLFEMYYTKAFNKGLGVDTSENSIKLANSCAKLSELENKLSFEVGNQEILQGKEESFDFIFSTNLLDVVPDEVTIQIFEALYKSLKKDKYMIICLNPDFTEDELVNLLKMEKRGQYYFKNDILRCNKKSINDWEKLFTTRMTLVSSLEFVFDPRETYKRRLFLLKK